MIKQNKCGPRLVVSLLTALITLMNTAKAAPITTTPIAPRNQTLKIMTFNLRYGTAPGSQNTWAQRRPVLKECLSASAPDIIGSQEGLYFQLKDMVADHPEYDWIGMGRDGGSQGEFMALLYRKARFEPLEFDHFWLSDTPDVVASKSWGNRVVRMVTWVKFRDLQTRREFYLWNTHLDHESQIAREKAAALILARINTLGTLLPVVLTGDFNAAARENPVYDMLTAQGGLSDTWFSAAQRLGPDVGTFHNYKAVVRGGYHIDWILSRGPVVAESSEVVTFEQGGQRPSDHFPVMATLRFDATPPLQR